MSTQEQRIAIVTGASRAQGIGAAICRKLAQMGIALFFTYWGAHDHALYGQGQAGPQELLAQLRELGIRCENIEQDLSDPQASLKIMDAVEERLGSPSILVNNAAHDDIQMPFEQITSEILDTYYAANIRGPIC